MTSKLLSGPAWQRAYEAYSDAIASFFAGSVPGIMVTNQLWAECDGDATACSCIQGCLGSQTSTVPRDGRGSNVDRSCSVQFSPVSAIHWAATRAAAPSSA